MNARRRSKERSTHYPAKPINNTVVFDLPVCSSNLGDIGLVPTVPVQRTLCGVYVRIDQLREDYSVRVSCNSCVATRDELAEEVADALDGGEDFAADVDKVVQAATVLGRSAGRTAGKGK